jgi:RNA polymerase subunit RPABC4/transcription elongation factor Spt4
LESRHCSQCLVGYAPTTRICPTCNVPLVSEAELGDRAIRVPEGSSAVPTAELVHIPVTGEIPHVQAVSDELLRAGISHRIGPPPGVQGGTETFAVFVRREDLARAIELEQRLLRRSLPDIPTDFDPSSHSASACPACGESVNEAELECASCGLTLGPPATRFFCPDCGAAAEEDATECPGCGGVFRERPPEKAT